MEANGERTLSDVAAENLRTIRDRRRLTTRELAQRLEQLGVKFVASSVSKAEQEDPSKRRRLDVDDVGALAVALDVPPWFLLAPRGHEPVAITPTESESGSNVGEWLRGGLTITQEQGGTRVKVPLADDAPTYARGFYEPRGEVDVAMIFLDRALQLARGAQRVHPDLPSYEPAYDPAEAARELREALVTVVRHVELIVERLDREAAGS